MLLSGEEWAIVGLSLQVSLVAIIGVLPFAFALAYLLARGRFPGKVVVDALVHLPLVLPPVVIGWMLLIAFAPHGVIGAPLARWLGITLMFRWTGAALAAGIMAMPLMVRSIRLSLEAIDPRLEAAARTLGARRFDRFVTITLPLARPGVLAGLVLGFARSLGEFGATITFVSNVPGETATLPLAIYAALQVPGQETAVWRLALVSVLLSLCALIASEMLLRRGRGRDRETTGPSPHVL